MIKKIFLDLDGPLLDGKQRHYQCYADILKANNYEPMPINDYWEMKRLRKTRREQLKVSGAESIYDLFLCEWIKNIESSYYLAFDHVQDGALEVLKQWMNDGIQLTLVTMRNNRTQLIRQLEKTGLSSYLNSVIVCQHAKGGTGKALEVLKVEKNIDASHCLWIGDTEADFDGAKYLNCHLVLLSCGLRTKEFLSTLGTTTIEDSLTKINVNNWKEYATSEM